MDDKIYKERLEAFKKLKSLGENPDLNKVYEIAKKYNLGYDQVVEFVPKNVAKKVYVLHNYCKMNILAILLILSKSKSLNKEMTNEQVIRHFVGMDKESAKELVQTVDEQNKEASQIWAENFRAIISGGLKGIVDKRYTEDNFNWTDEQFFLNGAKEAIEAKNLPDDIL